MGHTVKEHIEIEVHNLGYWSEIQEIYRSAAFGLPPKIKDLDRDMVQYLLDRNICERWGFSRDCVAPTDWARENLWDLVYPGDREPRLAFYATLQEV